MKIFAKFIPVLIAFSFMRCESPFVVPSPPPKAESGLLIIPEEYPSVYGREVDSIVLLIEEKIIYKEKKHESKILASEIASNSLSLKKKSLYYKELKEWFPAIQRNDTIIATISLKDTVFKKQTVQILKFLKGHLIIKEELEKDLWKVTILTPKQ